MNIFALIRLILFYVLLVLCKPRIVIEVLPQKGRGTSEPEETVCQESVPMNVLWPLILHICSINALYEHAIIIAQPGPHDQQKYLFLQASVYAH